MEIKILGSGCPNCKRLEKHARIAVAELGIDATFEKVTEYKDIMSYGIMSTPGLVVNGTVVSSGRVLQPKEIIPLLQK
jgi:small redox-active disulfide protein 2